MHHISISETSKLTQVPLQPSYSDLWLKPCPLSNELSIVTALSQWSSLQSKKRTSLPKTTCVVNSYIKVLFVMWPQANYINVIFAVLKCRVLPNPSNGQVTVNADGDHANYSCHEPYTLIGNTTRTCNSDGLWSGIDPTCKHAVQQYIKVYCTRVRSRIGVSG